MIIFGPIILLVLLAVVGGGTLILARWILHPLIDAGREPTSKTQFFLSDMYALVLQLAFVGLIVSQLSHRESRGVPTMIGLWALLILLWFIGIRMLSRAGVTRAWPRAVCLCIAIPGAYIGSFAASVLALAGLSSPVLLPILVIELPLVYVFCSGVAEWAMHSKYAVHSEP